MTRYILIRLLGILVVIYVVLTLTFFLMHAIPGGPFDEEKMRLPPEVKLAILRRYGLHEPLPKQYLRYLWNALHLDFGRSYESPGETVIALIGRVWPVSLHLGAMALSLAIALSLILGILSAIYQNSWIDYASTLLATLGIVNPYFVVAIFLILIFSSTLRWLPPGGWEGPKYWIMPVIAYSLMPMGHISRYVRTCVVEALHAEYVTTARAKGLRERAVITRHVLKNALIPVITAIGRWIPAQLTGTIYIESIFRIPGLGKFFVSSIYERDYPVIMGLTLLSTVFIAVTYLVIDILYVALDPRIRLR